MSKMAENLFKVFVYGTLKRAEPNHHWLSKLENGYSKFIVEGKTQQKYPLVIGTRYNIPFLLDKPGSGYQVQGEIYEVDKKMMDNLDILEDYPNYYDREVQPIITSEGAILDCWLYLIRNFPQRLYEKQHLENYRNCGAAPYVTRSSRTQNIAAKDDMAYYEDSSLEDVWANIKKDE